MDLGAKRQPNPCSASTGHASGLKARNGVARSRGLDRGITSTKSRGLKGRPNDCRAFKKRRAMQTFVSQIAREAGVWVAEDPEHMTHFIGERFLGPYPDVMPTKCSPMATIPAPSPPCCRT